MSDKTTLDSFLTENAGALFENIGDADTQVEPAKEQPVTDTEQQSAATEQQQGGDTEQSAGDRLRDEKGRFVKAPSSWKAGAKAKWEALDPEIQDEVDRREQDFHKGIESYKDRAARYDDFERAISPYQATLQSQGIDPIKAVSSLLGADHVLRYGQPQQKLQVIASLSQQYGIDLSPLFQQQQEQPYVDPEVQKINQKLSQLEQAWQQRELQAQQTQQAALQTEYNAFASNPENEHFATVRQDMAALLRAGRASTLKDAYEQAVWLNPATRQILLAKQQEQSRQEQIKKVQAAKHSSQVNIPRRGNVPNGAAMQESLDDVIRNAVREVGLM